MPDQMPYSQAETPAELSKPIETIKSLKCKHVN